jgi:hypothetical protein
VNVISLSGNTGLGENVVTSGLGPGPEAPPPPPPQRVRRGGAGAWVWHKKRQEEAEARERTEQAHRHFVAMRAAASQLAADTANSELQPGTFDRVVLPASSGLLRAPVSGWMCRRLVSSRAALVAEDGTRWLIDGLEPLSTAVDRYVYAGEAIGRAP